MDLNNRQTVAKKTPHFFMSKPQKRKKHLMELTVQVKYRYNQNIHRQCLKSLYKSKRHG